MLPDDPETKTNMTLRLLFVVALLAAPALAQNTGYNPTYTGTGNSCIAGGTCYYIDYEGGSDSNNGLSKGAAWKSVPGMACATGNPAEHALRQTDEFILKGGVRWPRACFPWTINGGGASSPNGYAYPGMYIGYDPTWNTGRVNSVRVTDPGSGCKSLTVVFTNAAGDSTGSGAAAAAKIDSNVGIARENLLSFVAVTSAGALYTKNPRVSFTGNCTASPTAVADITSPIMDGSAGVFGSAPSSMPQMFSINIARVTVDHIEFSHFHYYAGSDYACGPSPSMLKAGGANAVLQNLYVHDVTMNGPVTAQYTGCRDAAQSSGLYGGGDSPISTLNNSIFNNYESQSHGCMPGNQPPCVQNTAVFNMGINTNNIYNDWRGGLYTVGSASDFLVAGNKMWAMLQDADGGHGDTYYLMTGGVFYNNILRDIFPGTAAFYIETGDGNIPTIGNTSYVFNNVAWNIGTSTPPIGYSSEFTNSGAHSAASNPNLFAYNNTFYSYSGNSDCINAGQWFGTSPRLSANYNFTLKNNTCITTQQAVHWFNSNASPDSCKNGCAKWNALTQPNSGATQKAIDRENVVMSPGKAKSQGYTEKNYYAPTSNTNDTVKFASAADSTNLTSTCSTSLGPYSLAALCSDIKGNPRPASGGWEAGAYTFLSGRPPLPTDPKQK